MKTLSFLETYNFVLQLFVNPEPETDSLYKISDTKYVNLFIDSDWDLQVQLYADDTYEVHIDGGGICIMQSDEGEQIHIESILKTWTPQEICNLVSSKALFVWELIHSA